MRLILPLMILLMLLGCKQSSSTEPESLDWLLGTWTRENSKDTDDYLERWNKSTYSNEYYGNAYSIENNDTIVLEMMTIRNNGSNWILYVRMPEEAESTSFEMVDQTETSILFRNDTIDFPKNVEYKISSDKLHATISNDDKEIPFVFLKGEDEALGGRH